MDQKLKSLIEELGVAINEALGESEHVAEVIAEIKRSGYDVLCALSATIVIRKLEPEAGLSARPGGSLRSRLNAEDIDFLKSLHIVVNR